MKNTVKTKELLTMIKTCKKVALTRNTMPVISNIAFIADDLGLRLQATDLDVTLTHNIAVSLDLKPNTYLVQPGELIDFLSASDDFWTEIKQSDDASKLMFKTDKMTKEIGVDAEQAWPLLNKDLGELTSINVSDLEKVACAASDDETRWHLTGVYFDHVNQKLVATDGHRLHTVDTIGIRDSFILPKIAVDLIKGFNDRVLFSRVVDGFINIGLKDSFGLTVRVIDGKYPNYHQFIPKHFKSSISGDSEDFVKILKKASKLADKKTRSVTFEDNFLECNVGLKIDLGSINNLSPENDGQYNERFGVNCDYLLDAVKQASGNIDIMLNDSVSPMFFESKGFQAVIMPRRV
jgi:DNA polymerase III subunit beta